MNSYLARKAKDQEEKRQEGEDQEEAERETEEKELNPYIVYKRKRLSLVFRAQNIHLRPFYHVGTLRLEYSDKFNVLRKIYDEFGEGEYKILHFPPKRVGNGFRLFWKGQLPTSNILTGKERADDD